MSLEDVLTRLRFAKDEIERANAAEELTNYEGEQVIRALIDALGDKDQLVQVAAAESLKKCHPDPAPYLRTALSDTRLLVRWGAAELLAYYPSPETEAALRMTLEDRNSHVRGAAARSLRGMVRESATIAELRRLLDDSDSFPCYQALLTLSDFDPQMVDKARVIQRDLRSHEISTQLAAIHFIREEGKREWLAEIDKLTDHPDFRIRRAAKWAWERLNQEST